jgi:GNAT superfamily N-acetyltransferase
VALTRPCADNAAPATIPAHDRLAAHLATWLGRWPGEGPGLTVVGSTRRAEPGWDGSVYPVVGVSDADGRGVLSVPPSAMEAVRAVLTAGAEADRSRIPAAAGAEGRFFIGVFRWSTAPAELPDAGTWIAADDPSVPEWLRPFGGEVLVAVDPATGEHLSGVGIKRHDAVGHELAVVTRPAAEGRGLGRRLVAQAARRVLDEGRVPTYLHAVSNHASAHLATAAGFPDVGWTVYGTG